MSFTARTQGIGGGQPQLARANLGGHTTVGGGHDRTGLGSRTSIAGGHSYKVTPSSSHVQVGGGHSKAHRLQAGYPPAYGGGHVIPGTDSVTTTSTVFSSAFDDQTPVWTPPYMPSQSTTSVLHHHHHHGKKQRVKHTPSYGCCSCIVKLFKCLFCCFS